MKYTAITSRTLKGGLFEAFLKHALRHFSHWDIRQTTKTSGTVDQRVAFIKDY